MVWDPEFGNVPLVILGTIIFIVAFVKIGMWIDRDEDKK